MRQDMGAGQRSLDAEDCVGVASSRMVAAKMTK